ncbi:MAG TPA: type II toxin-antitoxin system HicA family toxin [Chloroflexota bacterium]|nr:type II toxin-antitoxin system HicA family toxin [Chloroflexota bacterium]
MRLTVPALRASQVLAILRRHGFEQIRQSGSHVVLRHADGRWTTVRCTRGAISRRVHYARSCAIPA